MERAERRRNAKNEKKEKKATYNLTREQLNHMVHERLEDELDHMRQEAMEEAINTAMLLLLTLPLKVLMDHYWKNPTPNGCQNLLIMFCPIMSSGRKENWIWMN